MAERARARMYHISCHLEEGLRLQSGTSLVRSECNFSRRNASLLFARQGHEARGQFTQLRDTNQATKSLPADSEKPAKPENASNQVLEEEPLYGRAVKSQGDDTPLFARPTLKPDEQEFHKRNSRKSSVESSGFQWCPRMDVVESDTEHTVTIELPGVSAESIRVEIDCGRLIVTGSRSREWWNISENSGTKTNRVCHREELSYGPYRSVWTIPNDANLSGATAEFFDGLLRVILPKL